MKFISLKASKQPGRYSLGLNLYLDVAKNGGSASWIFRWRIAGRERWKSIGPVNRVSEEEARKIAIHWYTQWKFHGIEPGTSMPESPATAAG